MEKLFSEKEIFTKARPLKLPDSEAEKFYRKMAKEIIDNDWSKSDLENIVNDLKELKSWRSGFECAKELDESYSEYDINSEFVAWLEDFGWQKDEALNQIVKQWVSIHNPQPIFPMGSKLFVGVSLNSKILTGQIIWITGIKWETAEYLYWDEEKHNGGYVAAYEKIEGSCRIIEN